ncbi:MAG: hypothetical protein ABF760_05615 [Zymomonas mobilis]|uniref:hypothetical protein n=1 Tax=Zymomonas mobilis TaxID=542 RepID=UPI0021AB40D0|nr:hypothetical protein [Zymomonas mobilis]
MLLPVVGECLFFSLPSLAPAMPPRHFPHSTVMEIHLNVRSINGRNQRPLPPPPPPPDAPFNTQPPEAIWHEKKGPRCISPESIGAAAVSEKDSVDLMLKGGSRIRAHLENCPALDFYSGFYVHAGPDGQICAKRDPVYARWGGECLINRFRVVEGVLKH